MIAILLMLLSGAEYSHPRGVDGITCAPSNEAKQWVCKAACWYGTKPDGGTYGTPIRTTGGTEQEARAKLQKVYENGCKQ